MSKLPRLVRVALSLAALAAPCGDARADGKEACVEAHALAQVARQAGRLLEARERLFRCARPECPAVLQEECAQWLGLLEASIPTLVFEVRDEHGADVTAATLSVDGVVRLAELGGRALEIDPGERLLRVEARDGRAVEQRVLVREGERNRKITLALAAVTPTPPPPPPIPTAPTLPPPPPPERGGPSPFVYVLGGLGAIGLAGFAAFGILGKEKQADLEDGCGQTRSCPPEDVDAMYRDFTIADVSLAVGSAALVAATVWLVVHFTTAADEGSASTGSPSRRPLRLRF
jgi:hypothetical protein